MKQTNWKNGGAVWRSNMVFGRLFKKQIQAPLPTLYLVRGCSGNGKSSLASALTDRNVAADDFPGLYNPDGSYNIDLQANSHEWCLECVQQWMQQGEAPIAVHNVFAKREYIEPYLKIAKEYGYAVHIIHAEAVVLPNGRRTGNVHGVPEEVLERQRRGWESWDKADLG